MSGKTLGKIALLGSAIAVGSNEVDAQARNVLSQKQQDSVNIANIHGIDSLSLAKQKYEELSPEIKSRISPLYFFTEKEKHLILNGVRIETSNQEYYISKNKTEGSVPMYAVPGFYEKVGPFDPLYLKMAAQKPIGYLSADSSEGSRPVYVLGGDANRVYFGNATHGSSARQEKKIQNKTNVKSKKKSVKTSARQQKKASKLERKTQKEFQEKEAERLREKQHVEYQLRQEKENVESRNDSSQHYNGKDSSESQYAQPLDMHVNADSSDLKHDYASDTTAKNAYVPTPAVTATENLESKTLSQSNPVMQPVSRKDKTRFGLEASLGIGKERVVGAFVDIPLTSWLAAEGYGNWYVAKSDPYAFDLGTEVTSRDKLLIGPATYKQRTDETHMTAEEMAIADIGAGLTLKVTDYFELPLRAGLSLVEQKKITEGKSTIDFERNNQPLGSSTVITNTKYENSKTNNLNLSAGARFNVTKNLSFGVSGNRSGKVNSARLNLGWRF